MPSPDKLKEAPPFAKIVDMAKSLNNILDLFQAEGRHANSNFEGSQVKTEFPEGNGRDIRFFGRRLLRLPPHLHKRICHYRMLGRSKPYFGALDTI
jgi:hypothetical protein